MSVGESDQSHATRSVSRVRIILVSRAPMRDGVECDYLKYLSNSVESSVGALRLSSTVSGGELSFVW